MQSIKGVKLNGEMSAGMEGGEISFRKPFCLKMNCLISRRKESKMTNKTVKLYMVMAIYFYMGLCIHDPPFIYVIDGIDQQINGMHASVL